MEDDLARVSDLLWHSWQDGTAIDVNPSELRIATRKDGYVVQRRLAERVPGAVSGWKIAATSLTGQKHINVTGPLAGRIFSERLYREGAVLSLRKNRMRVAEIEFVFMMNRSLPPRSEPYSLEESMRAIGDMHLGIEVPDSRYIDYCAVGEALIIADNACAHEFVLGPRVSAVWREADLSAHQVRASVAGRSRSYQRDGVGANVLGDPRVALTWLVNELSTQDIVLEAGQFVTTGTCLVPLEVEAGDVVRADFGEFGCVGCQFGI